MTDGGGIGREGRNFWKRLPADRVAFLIDAAAYFGTLAEALESARRSVIVLGWDVHSRVRLRRDARPDDSELARLLDRIVRRRRGLHVHLLSWDFAMVYALEREFLPLYHFGWKTHRRVHFALDDEHPLGGCHHQKLVVIDDRLAFVGGLDLTMRRWDTPDHRPDDERRVDPHGEAYDPFHDVQVALSGSVATALGELARTRWHRATGRRLRTPEVAEDPWPPGLEPDLRDVDVAIARTQPRHRDVEEVREIEALYEDAIGAARRAVFIENQYFSSKRVADAIARSLQRATGPEVLVVLPRRPSGWLEESTVGLLQARVLERLRQADHADRLRVFYPNLSTLDGVIKVHSKVCVVDDDLVTVGSANLSNRSMGLDTECNVVIESGGDGKIRRALAGFRDRLLGEHLGVPATQVASKVAESSSLIRAVEQLRGGSRSLEPLESDPPRWAEAVVSDLDLLDPERPVEPGELVERLSGDSDDARGGTRWPVLLMLAFVLGALALTWRLTPLGEWASVERMRSWIEAYRASPLALGLTAGLYVVAGLLMFPVTLLILSTAAVFGPLEGLLHALTGSLASALTGFGVGRVIGRGVVRRIGGKWVTRISGGLQRQGVVALTAVRLVPVAPFTVVNLVAGACGVRAGPFTLGTLLGMAPGIAALTLVGGQAVRWLLDPGWLQAGWLAAASILAVAILVYLRRRSRRAR